MADEQPHDKALALQLTMEKLPDGRIAVQSVRNAEVQPVRYFDDQVDAITMATDWLKETRV